ncbi:MAG TPA: GAF domain-containing sensor histidine kinase [Anaerolineaceae bacterium]
MESSPHPPTLSREQLENRLEALHEASLGLVRNVSLDSLLENIATLACQQVGARYAAVGVLDAAGKLEKFIPVGMTKEEVARMEHPPRGLGLIGHLMRHEKTIRIPDIEKDPRGSGFPPHHPEMHSFLGVPIRQGNTSLGQIYLTDKAGGQEFTSEDQRMIETLATYAAVAIQNARLYEGMVARDQILTRRNENLALLNDLASTLASSPDNDQILDRALNQVMDYLRLDVGEVFLRLEEGKLLNLVLHRGDVVPALFAKNQYRIGEGIVGMTAQNGQPLLLEVPGPGTDGLSAKALDGRFNQVACFPLVGRRGVLGVMCLGSCHEQPLGELEMQFLSAISLWVSTAIENVHLSLQGRRLAVLEERERIGMDLHDGIIQSIYAVGLTLEHARLLLDEAPTQARARIEQAINDLNSTIRDIRAYILDLRPRQLHDENLMQGLQRLASEFRANTLLEANLQGPADGLQALPQPKALALFHITQEALANIAKHAHAKRVSVSLWSTPDRVLLEVSDDGRGFDMSMVNLTLGHGLANMQTRARNVGGDVEISSEPDAGTTILAWVPLE